jgi:Uma2 family endonuclease
MSTATTIEQYTPEDLLSMPDGDAYELVDGRLVERKMSMLSSHVAGNAYELLKAHCRPARIGWVFPEGASFQCFPDDPKKVRRADASFISIKRLSAQQVETKGHSTIVPDLVVEVVSPHDSYNDVDEKLAEWLDAGAKLIWIVNPLLRQVRVNRPDQPERKLMEDDELSGEDVVPGFRCVVGDLFWGPEGDVTRSPERNGE